MGTKKNEWTFYISLFFIMVVSVLDVNYVGNHYNLLIPVKYHQPIHLLALLMVMAIGYYNWGHYPEKWLKYLWLAMYGCVILLLFVTGFLVLVHAPLHAGFISFVASVRNWCTWPIAFILFYFFPIISKR